MLHTAEPKVNGHLVWSYPLFCGVKVATVALIAHGILDESADPKLLLPKTGWRWLLYRTILFGALLPGMMLRILTERGLEVETRNAGKLGADAKINLLKQTIDNGNRVIMYVRRNLFAGHWIMLEGYSDNADQFFVYNPDPEHHANGNPVGNDRLSKDRLIEMWHADLIVQATTLGRYHGSIAYIIKGKK